MIATQYAILSVPRNFTTMFSKNNNAQTVWVGLSFLVVGLMAGLLVANSESLVDALDDNDELAEENQETFDVNELEVVDVSTDNDAVLGDPDAPVTIVEFSDFQCPYCRSFFNETLPQLISDYVDTGKVKIVYRDFPLSGHAQASSAAQAAECARSIANSDEAYYTMHDWLFENMATWSGQSTANELFIAAAQDELDVDIRTCLESGEMQDEVNADMTAGRGYGVSGTPSFFINGKKIVGAYPYEIFQAVIESEL